MEELKAQEVNNEVVLCMWCVCVCERERERWMMKLSVK